MRQLSAYPVRIPSEGIEVILVELAPHDLMKAMRLAGNDTSETVAGLKVTHEALRMSIRESGGKAVTYSDLRGAGWDKHFPRTRHLMKLSDVWTRVHMPSSSQEMVFTASVGTAIDSDGEVWTATLPDGRSVAMREQHYTKVQDVMRQAEQASRAKTAQALQSTIDSCRACLVTIDGAPVPDLEGTAWDNHFSTIDTFLMGSLWALIHTGDSEGDIEVGEARPVSGS